MEQYRFKIADEDWEFDQIHRLNYQTFVEEIPQHERKESGILVDRFHSENTYVVCVSDNELLGMIAVRDKRLFSLDEKIKDLDSYLPAGCESLCELRLLAIRSNKRYRKIIKGLFTTLASLCESRGYDTALISATTTQLRLYRNLGFTPFGPLVGSEGAQFQPMYLTFDSYSDFKRNSLLLRGLGSDKNEEVPNSMKEEFLFLPGPVELSDEVKREFERSSVSHRSERFLNDFRETKSLLCSLVNARNAEILTGTGTLANDVIAGQLSLMEGKGMILSNGEFGERLRDHALRFNLNFTFINENWGDRLQPQRVEYELQNEDIVWLWLVHCETSTGVLNDLEDFSAMCERYSVRLCVDCISSIGNVPVNLEDVYLASGVSGKGLASYPGLCFVFYNSDILPHSTLPRYMDIGYFRLSGGVPFTIPSNLLYALKKSVETTDLNERFMYTAQISSELRAQLEDAGLEVLGTEGICSPSVVTFRLPDGYNAEIIGRELDRRGYYISYRSAYLKRRNLMQIALMGQFAKSELGNLVSVLRELTGMNQVSNFNP